MTAVSIRYMYIPFYVPTTLVGGGEHIDFYIFVYNRNVCHFFRWTVNYQFGLFASLVQRNGILVLFNNPTHLEEFGQEA